MTVPKTISGLVLGLLLTAATPVVPDAQDADGVLQGLQAWLDGTRSLSGRFEQELVSSALGGGEADRGRVYVQRPGQMRFEYEEPEPMTAMLVGEQTWVYVPDLRQLTRGSLDDETDLFPRLLVGEGRLADLFLASIPDDGESVGRGQVRLRLVPMGDDGAFESVTLTLRSSDYAIEQADVRDGTGSHVIYRFSRLKRNRALPAGIFDFQPPAGTRIVDGY
jgi:outer membrane lipoprotein carrier protein